MIHEFKNYILRQDAERVERVLAKLTEAEAVLAGLEKRIDVTEQRKAEETIRKLAMIDTLTGLSNRNHFETRLAESIALAKRQKSLLALMLLDLDKFKPVNDTYGHPVGDELLKRVADILIGTRRNVDTVARLGGEELIRRADVALYAVKNAGRNGYRCYARDMEKDGRGGRNKKALPLPDEDRLSAREFDRLRA